MNRRFAIALSGHSPHDCPSPTVAIYTAEMQRTAVACAILYERWLMLSIQDRKSQVLDVFSDAARTEFRIVPAILASCFFFVWLVLKSLKDFHLVHDLFLPFYFRKTLGLMSAGKVEL